MLPFVVLSQQIDFYVYKHIFIVAMGRMCERIHSDFSHLIYEKKQKECMETVKMEN